MKICIPTESNEGLGAAVAGHLGRAPFLTLVDTENGEVDVLTNAPHAHGSCAPVAPLAGRSVDAVVCAGAGRRAVANLEAAGLQVLLTTAPRVDGAVAAAREGRLTVLGASQACSGHADAGSNGGACHRHE